MNHLSERFSRFIREVGESTEFSPSQNKLLNFFTDFAVQRRQKYYNKMMFVLRMKWPKYRQGGRISHLLRKMNSMIFVDWLTTIFIFRKKPLILENPFAVSNVDFALDLGYTFSKEEMSTIKTYLVEKGSSLNSDVVAKRVWFYSIFSLAKPISEIFERPFAFILGSSDGKFLDNGDYVVQTKITAREQ